MSSGWSNMAGFLSVEFIVGKGNSCLINPAIQLSEEQSRSLNGAGRFRNDFWFVELHNSGRLQYGRSGAAVPFAGLSKSLSILSSAFAQDPIICMALRRAGDAVRVNPGTISRYPRLSRKACKGRERIMTNDRDPADEPRLTGWPPTHHDTGSPPCQAPSPIQPPLQSH
jgi:hypothetical protein